MRRAIFRRQQSLSTAQKKVTTCPLPCLTLLCFGSSFQTWSCTRFIDSYCFHRSQENLYIYSGVWWKEVWYVYSMVFHSYKVKPFFSNQQPALIQYTLSKFSPFAISTSWSKVSETIFRYFFIAFLWALPIPKQFRQLFYAIIPCLFSKENVWSETGFPSFQNSWQKCLLAWHNIFCIFSLKKNIHHLKLLPQVRKWSGKVREFLSMIREAYDSSVCSYWKNGCCSW